MNPLRVDDQFSNALRAELISRVQKASPSRRRTRSRLWLSAGVLVGTGLLGGIGAAAGLFVTPGGQQETPLSSPVEGTFTGTSPTETAKSNDAYANIPSDEIQHDQSDVDFLWDAKDPYYGYNKYSIVARVHIDSIDGGRVFSPIFNQYTFPQTIGKMTIQTIYKGDVKPGAQLTYNKGGGIVPFDEYWKSLNPQQQDKFAHLNGGQKPTGIQYVKKMYSEDVDITVGKDYIALLLPQQYKDGTAEEYSIQGFQYGFREVRGSGAETTVLNNETKEWESLGSIVP